MSYTRTYTKNIHINGSKNVYIAPSDTGKWHTVPYDENVSVTMNTTVDTNPFDISVNNANSDIDGLTASVVAMNAANCAAITDNAEKISQSLIDGFYHLMENDVSVKKTESKSALESKMALLIQLAKDTRDKHERMSEDIDRLYAHYASIFHGLDEDLEKRIKSLDKSAFELSDRIRQNILIDPLISTCAATVNEIESQRQTSGSITIARIRRKTSQVIGSMADSLKENLRYRRTMKDTLWNDPVEEAENIYIPVAYIFSDGINDQNMYNNYYLSKNLFSDEIVSAVKAYAVPKQREKGEQISADEFRLIDQAFSSMLEESFINQDKNDIYNERVYSEMLRLWQSGKSEIKRI